MSFLAKILEEQSKNKLIAPCFYTTGFEGKDFTHLPALLDYLDAVLIDIRFDTTDGCRIEWRKNYLRLLLKNRYRHVPHLGSRISKGTITASVLNLSLGVKIITEMRENLLLMCECRKFEDCHRSVISESLKSYGYETQEISDWISFR